MELKPFNKQEKLWTSLIFLVLIAVSIPNFMSSLKRSRDATRKNDLGAMVAGLDEFFEDFGMFPLAAPDGRVIACLPPGASVSVDKKGRTIAGLVPCEWGKDSLADLTPGSSKKYVEVIPNDPIAGTGRKYIYFSNGARYQIFAALEEVKEDEFDPEVFARGLDCGSQKCNAGRAYSGGPINISIEEWEAQIEKARLNFQ